MTTTTLDELAILRLADVIRLTGLCKSSIYQMMKDGTFPRRIALGCRSVGWMACDIRDWLHARRIGRDNSDN